MEGGERDPRSRGWEGERETPTSRALRESVKRMDRSVGVYKPPDQPFICWPLDVSASAAQHSTHSGFFVAM
jgi:hypothetical protein